LPPTFRKNPEGRGVARFHIIQVEPCEFTATHPGLGEDPQERVVSVYRRRQVRSYATLGLLAALREIGQAGKVAFVGFDASEQIIDGLRKRALVGVAVQQPFMMGCLGVRTAVQAIQGKPVDSEIDTDVKIVTRENTVTPEIQLLLGPVRR
jgi:hypothetical protein